MHEDEVLGNRHPSPAGPDGQEGPKPSLRLEGILLVGCMLLLASLLTLLWESRHNTLGHNGHWVATKSSISRLPPGAFHFLYTRVALAENHLDLSVWHGFNEVYYRESLEPDVLEFDLRLEPGAWIAVMLDGRTDETGGTGGTRGIRLSSTGQIPSALFALDEDGLFEEKQALEGVLLEPARWTRIRLKAKGETTELWLDGALGRTLELPLGVPLKLGFRGGSRQTLLDNIAVLAPDGGMVFEEGFENTRRLPLVFAICLALVLGANVLLRLRRSNRGEVLLALIGLDLLCALLCVGLYLFDFYILSSRYPRTPRELSPALEEAARDPALPARARETARNALRIIRWEAPHGHIGPDPGYFTARLRRKYGLEGDMSVYRILFVGASQTHGDGVSEEAYTFVKRTEQLLNSSEKHSERTEQLLKHAGQRLSRRQVFGEPPSSSSGAGEKSESKGEGDLPEFQCINAGIPATNSRWLIDYYRSELIRLEPDMTIVNLSSNEEMLRPEVYANDLEAFVDVGRAHGVRTVFSLEPNAAECMDVPYLRAHGVMSEVARQRGISVLNLQHFLYAKYDRGFLWWDCVHMTRGGQKLAAEFLALQIEGLLNRPSR